jgi:hypothetical protein
MTGVGLRLLCPGARVRDPQHIPRQPKLEAGFHHLPAAIEEVCATHFKSAKNRQKPQVDTVAAFCQHRAVILESEQFPRARSTEFARHALSSQPIIQ